MIRRWGFIAFFLLGLLSSAGTWVISYWFSADVGHSSKLAGAQEVYAGDGWIFVVAGDFSSKPSWIYSGRIDSFFAKDLNNQYREAPLRFLGFAFNPDADRFWTPGNRQLIIPLWFPTVLSALGLLWAWRRKRRIDRTRRGGFEVQPAEPPA